MDFYVSSRITQEQLRAEQMRRQAVLQSGYSFIVLQLLDRTKKRVSGVETLTAKTVESQTNPGMIEYSFDIKSGPLIFEADAARGGMLTAYLLDTEWNRALLGSHYTLGYWSIVDVISGTRDDVTPITRQDVIADVKKRNEHSLKTIIRTPKGNVPQLTPPAVTKTTVESLPDSVIDEKLARLQEEKTRREKLKKNREEMAKHPVGAMRKKAEADVPPEPNMSEDSLVTVK